MVPCRCASRQSSAINVWRVCQTRVHKSLIGSLARHSSSLFDWNKTNKQDEWTTASLSLGERWMDSSEANNCSSICTRNDLSRIRKVTIKKRLVWLTGKFIREHVAVNRRCAKVGSLSLQYLQTWHVIVSNLFVSFSINGLKENVESLHHYPF